MTALAQTWRRPLVAVIATGGLLGGCAVTPTDATAPTPRLAAYLKGSFVGEAPDGGGDVRLRAEPVFVDRWDLHDGLYLLIERSAADGASAQELWRLVPGPDSRAVVETWLAAGAGEAPDAGRLADREVEALGPQGFRRQRGCDMSFTLRPNGEFFGAHDSDDACQWTADGDGLLWRELTLTPNQILWRERGTSTAGLSSWASDAGVVFDRLER